MARIVLAHGTVTDLGQIAEWITEQALACGFDTRMAFKIQMAVDEACSNVFTHGYEERPGRLEVEANASGAQLEILIRDWGRAFDPGAVSAPDTTAPLEARSIGGLGLFLMRQLMDEVSYTFDARRGNVLRMVKRR